MGPPEIEKLPPELQQRIVSYIPRPSDLKALCLATKQLRLVTTPELYMEVFIDPSNSDHVDSFCTLVHPGHRHVRKLAFSYRDCEEQNGVPERAQAAVRLILQLLPRNGLRELRLPGDIAIDKDTVTLVCTQQRALRSLDLGTVIRGVPGVCGHPEAWLSNLEGLDMPLEIGSVADLDFYGCAIRTCKNLNWISIRHVRLGGERFGSDDTASEDGLLFSRLLGQNPPRSAKAPFRNLVLDGVYLAYADRTYLRAIDFTALTSLSLINCGEPGPVLSYLANHFESSRAFLRAFSFVDTIGYCDMDLLMRFLGSFSTLEYLYIKQGPAQKHFDASCLKQHGSSLAHLYLSFGASCAGIGHSVLSLEAVQSMSQSCKRLRQLALAFPAIAIGEAKAGQLGTLAACVDHLRTLPSLEILRILTWPSKPDCYTWGDPATELCELYSRQLNDYADHVVGRLAPQAPAKVFKLKVLCIGDVFDGAGPFKSSGNASVEPLKAACYVIGRNINCLGQPRPVALPTERHLIGYIEPAFDVFSKSAQGYDYGIGSNKCELPT